MAQSNNNNSGSGNGGSYTAPAPQQSDNSAPAPQEQAQAEDPQTHTDENGVGGVDFRDVLSSEGSMEQLHPDAGVYTPDEAATVPYYLY